MRSGRRGRLGAAAAAAAVCLLAAGCGARVTEAQIQAARQDGVDTGLGGTGAPATGPSGATGAEAADPSASDPTGATPAGGASSSAPGVPVSSAGATPSAGGVVSVGGGSTSGGSGSSSASGGGPGAASSPGASRGGVVNAPVNGANAGLRISSSVCKGPASGPGISASQVSIGNVSTITGPVPGLFIGAHQGATAFAAYVNSIGGICGRKLSVQSADDDLDASTNATATTSLAGSVFAFVGSFSAVDEGGAAALASDGVPDVGEALSSARFNLANNFSPEPKPTGWNLAPYIYLKQKNPTAAQHMAALSEDVSTSQQITKAEVAGLESIGYKFVYTDYNIQPTMTDFTNDVEAMKNSKAQGVVYYGTAPYYADVSKAIEEVGISPFPDVFYGTDAYDVATIKDAGSTVNGDVFYQPEAMYQGEDAQSVPMVGLLDEWYEALYHTPPDEYAMYGWMSGLLFVEGLDEGGGLTRADLIKGLKKVTNFNAGGLMAPANPAGKKPPTCYLLIDVVNGKFKRDPADPARGFDCKYAPDYYYYKG